LACEHVVRGPTSSLGAGLEGQRSIVSMIAPAAPNPITALAIPTNTAPSASRRKKSPVFAAAFEAGVATM
jgi:hypothetical protein